MIRANFIECFIDGDHLTVVRDDFVNLQESPAVFVPLDKLRMDRIEKLKKGDL